jgi:hypothetical protein
MELDKVVTFCYQDLEGDIHFNSWNFMVAVEGAALLWDRFQVKEQSLIL